MLRKTKQCGVLLLTIMICIASFSVSESGAEEIAVQSEDDNLEKILEKSTLYFKKIDEMYVRFFCREIVKENLLPIPHQYRGFVAFFTDPEETWVKLHSGDPIRNEYEYDYQMIRRGKRTRERRILLRENGRETREENVKLKTLVFDFQSIGYGPAIFDEKTRKFFDFTVLQRVQVMGRTAYLVQADPKTSLGGQMMWGKYWIDSEDYSCLRIEYSPESMGHYQGIERKSKALRAKPFIQLLVEYGVKYGDVRFPTRFSLREEYRPPDALPFALSTLEVTYDDFHFFQVDVSVEENKES